MPILGSVGIPFLIDQTIFNAYANLLNVLELEQCLLQVAKGVFRRILNFYTSFLLIIIYSSFGWLSVYFQFSAFLVRNRFY